MNERVRRRAPKGLGVALVLLCSMLGTGSAGLQGPAVTLERDREIHRPERVRCSGSKTFPGTAGVWGTWDATNNCSGMPEDSCSTRV